MKRSLLSSMGMGIALLWIQSSAPSRAEITPAEMPPAEIDSFSPQGTVKKIRQVTARFTETMVPFGDPRLAEPFEIQCPEKGKARWADGKTWIYDFDHDLPAGVQCKFSLKPNLTTLSGKTVSGQTQFEFSTGGPVILQSVPYEGKEFVDEMQIFILYLDGETTEESILANVFFSVANMPDPVGVRIVSGTEREKILASRNRGKISPFVVLIQPTLQFPADTEIRLVWGKGVQSKSGVATEQDHVLPFKTRGLFTAHFSCERENPKRHCIPIQALSLYFSAPVSWDQAKKIILIGPGGEKRYPQILKDDEDDEGGEGDVDEETEKPSSIQEGEGDSNLFVSNLVFSPPFPPNATFTLKIPPSLVDDTHRVLFNADRFPLKVHTDDYPPLAKFPSHFGILERYADPMLPLTVRNIEPTIATQMRRIGKKTQAPEEKQRKGFWGILQGKRLRVSSDKTDQEEERWQEIISWINRIMSRNEYEDRARSVFEGITEKGTPASEEEKFFIPRPHGAKGFEVIGIPLKKPGFYVVEVESRILGEALLGQPAPMYVPTAVLVTNIAVHFKWGRESSLVWVTTLSRGRPVKNATVTVRGCYGRVLWKGKTDQEGMAPMASFPVKQEISSCTDGHFTSDGLFIIAEDHQGNLAFTRSGWNRGIESWRFNLPVASYLGPIVAHTLLDRSLLRAGETVHMKHILRQHGIRGFSHVEASKRPKTALIYHEGSDQRYFLPLVWDNEGIAETTWTIPKEARLGLYKVFLLTESLSNTAYFNPWDHHLSGKFQVGAFRVPLMRGTIHSPAEPLVSPKDVPVDLTVQYLSGGGAASLPVTLRGQLRPSPPITFDAFEDFRFSNGSVQEGIFRSSDADQEAEQPSSFPFPRQSLVLDKGGGVRATFSPLPEVTQPMEMVVELEFPDPNGEVQTVSSKIPVWPTTRLIGIKPDSWLQS